MDYASWTGATRVLMGLQPGDAPRLLELWTSLHVDEASWSTNRQHRLVPEASHYIQFDAPEVAIEAITWVVDQVNQKVEAE